MDSNERDERNAFGELGATEQKAIRFLLDCAALTHDLKSRYIRGWLAEDRSTSGLALSRAAQDQLAPVGRLADQLAHKENWTDAGLNADVFYGAAVRIAVFCLSNDLIRTFGAFDFLFVRLFGGAVRPLTPSLFVATLLHPDVSFEVSDTDEIEKATYARSDGWGIHQPVWFPNRPNSPEEPPST